MKNQNLIKIALIGLAAGLCLSAKGHAPSKKEIAFTKCSREPRKCDTSCGSSKERDGCNANTSAGRNGYTKEEYVPTADDIAAKRKSAARKVLDGE